MTLYKKKYRVETTRLSHHNYADGIYFVTICTKKKLQWFGEIRDGKMELNEIGKIVETEWRKTPKIRPYVRLDDFCIMPNHIHGIIVIENVETCGAHVSERIKTFDKQSEAEKLRNEEELEIETRAPRVSTKKLVLQPKGLGSILNQLKGTLTKQIHSMNYPDFSWQPRYHDHIIRSEPELTALKKYIRNNPECWDKETIPWHADAATFSL